MKLLSTVIAENSVERTYADNTELDDASTLLIVRMPKEVENAKSLAFHRYWALSDLRQFIDEQMTHERKASEGSL